ncbi:MAG: sigma-54-dependent transcriptional regulator [Candidatus Zixiibacteriota bacterium]
MSQILVIEDEVLLAKSLCRSLVKRGHDCVMATSAEEGLKLIEQTPTDIVLLDLQLPGMSGIEAIKHIRRFDSNISVLITTAYATMSSAVEAMRYGACDFLRKPVDIEEVILAVDRAISDARLKQTISYYHDVEAEKTDEDKLICYSEKMKEAAQLVDKLVATKLDNPSDFPPLLILGETGTGKDLVARIMHYHGKFSQEPFIEVNCTTLPKGLEEAELFGYEKGSFTGADKSKRGLFEAATGGTIFLNEIGDLPMETQAKLLQVIEQKCLRHVGGLRDIEVNVRIIAATNRELKDSNTFREDLYYRLNNVIVELPPLRERREDIIILADLFLEKFCRKYNKSLKLNEETKQALRSYSWPGNVRELRQLMERITLLSNESTVSIADLNLPIIKESTVTIDTKNNIKVENPQHGIDLEKVEKEIIKDVLIALNGNVSEAARKLNMSREALRYRIKKYNISKSVNIVG